MTVSAPDLTDPTVISWMHDFEQRVLHRHGFSSGQASCRSPRTEICPEISLPDFLYGDRQRTPSERRIKALLRLLPDYVSQAIVTRDPASGKPVAQYAYPLPPVPVDKAPSGAFTPDNGLPELLALSNNEFVAVERAFADGVGNTIRLVLATIEADTTNVQSLKSLQGASYKPMKKQLLLEMPITYQGVKIDNIAGIARAGADTFVAGSAIFGTKDYTATIAAMRNELAKALKS